MTLGSKTKYAALAKIIAQRIANTFYAMEAGQDPAEDQEISAGDMDLGFNVAEELYPWFNKAWKDGAAAAVVSIINCAQITGNPYV